MTPHYYGFYSRMGLPNAPIGSTELNVGVESAPAAILTPELLQKHPGTITNYHFPTPNSGGDDTYWKVLATHTQAAADCIARTISPSETQIVIGGDHSVTFASILGVSQRLPLDSVAYLQIDAHLDLNTVASSPSGNFHGMYVRAMVAEIGQNQVDSLIQPKLPVTSLHYLGNLTFDPDPSERNFILDQHIWHASVARVRQNPHETLNTLVERFSFYEHLHISLDIDGFDHTIAPATGIPCQSGFQLNDILPLLEILKTRTNSLSVDIVEVNPRKLGAATTIATAHQILTALLD